MSGFESGAIQSIRSNKNLRRGPGQKFKESMYTRNYLPVPVYSKKDSALIQQANEQRKVSIKKELLWFVLAGIIVYKIIAQLVI